MNNTAIVMTVVLAISLSGCATVRVPVSVPMKDVYEFKSGMVGLAFAGAGQSRAYAKAEQQTAQYQRDQQTRVTAYLRQHPERDPAIQAHLRQLELAEGMTHEEAALLLEGFRVTRRALGRGRYGADTLWIFASPYVANSQTPTWYLYFRERLLIRMDWFFPLGTGGLL